MSPSIGRALEVFPWLLQVRQECNGRIPAQGRLAGEALPGIDSPSSRELVISPRYDWCDSARLASGSIICHRSITEEVLDPPTTHQVPLQTNDHGSLVQWNLGKWHVESSDKGDRAVPPAEKAQSI
jgi:hypothetical protein